MKLFRSRIAGIAAAASLLVAFDGSFALAQACAAHYKTKSVRHASYTQAARRPIVIPAGTAFPVTLANTVSTRTHEPGDRVVGRLARSVAVRGMTVFPRGSRVDGHVVLSDRAGKAGGRAELQIAWDRVVAYGVATPVRAYTPVVQGESSTSGDLKRAGGGAAAGAVVGGILGGKSGILKGAVVGGAAGTAASLLKRGPDAKLEAGDVVYSRLSRAVRVTSPTLIASARRSSRLA